MATEKVGIYRNYYGPIPVDKQGRPLPKSEWPHKRSHSWVVRWFNSDGQRYSRSFPTRKEADLFAEEKQSDVRQGQSDEPRSMTLKEFADTYMKIRTDLAAGTALEHARTLKYLQETLGSNRLVEKITPVEARKFLSQFRQRRRKEKTVSPSTVNKVLRECRRIFREAVDCRLIRTNPFYGMREEKVASLGWHYITLEEYRKLLQACRLLRWRGIISLAYCCGLRIGEILNLTWQDIDFEKDILRVVGKRGGKGIIDWSPKDKDLRLVPLPGPVVDILTSLQAQEREGQTYIFVTGKGPNEGQRMERQNTWRDFDVIRRRAGLPECSLHDLRKSYCTNLSGRVPLHVVQELAGHSDIRTTRKYYVKVQPELFEAARQAMEVSLQS
jgi:integrase